MREVLCGQVRAAVPDPGDLLSGSADWVFRGNRGGAWHCLAVGGLTGAASFRGHRAGRVHTRPLNDFAYAATDRSGHASRSIPLGVGRTGRSRAAARPADRDRCDDLGSQRGDAFDCAARHGRELRGVSAGFGEGVGDGDARRGKTWRGWIAKMKDGRTHLAHKAEHAVDLDTGAVVAVTLQGADQGDTTTLDETLGEAGMAVAEQVGREVELRPNEEPKVNVDGIEETVADKGYDSGAVMQRMKGYGVRSYIPEKKQKGQRNWTGKQAEQQAVYANRRRVRGEYGKSLLRRRGELVERSFAHCYETGGMRRCHLRGHNNILKRQLVHVGAFNLSLIPRKLLGAGTPRELRNRAGRVFSELLRFLCRMTAYSPARRLPAAVGERLASSS